MVYFGKEGYETLAVGVAVDKAITLEEMTQRHDPNTLRRLGIHVESEPFVYTASGMKPLMNCKNWRFYGFGEFQLTTLAGMANIWGHYTSAPVRTKMTMCALFTDDDGRQGVFHIMDPGCQPADELLQYFIKEG